MSKEIKNKINNAGFPLQRFCTKTLQKHGWQVEEEYPVEQNTPLNINPYTDKNSIFETIRTSGDLRALFPKINKNFALCVCVSCKRQLNIDWAFMKSTYTENKHLMMRIMKNSRYGSNSYRFDLDDNWKTPLPFCNIPTNLQKANQNTPKEQDKIVQTASNLYLEVSQTMNDYEESLDNYLPYNQIIFIPVIVTAAKIHIYDVDETNFEVDNEDVIKIEPVDCLLYRHSLPRSLHRYLFDVKLDDVETILKEFNTFVVHYKYFDSFIISLIKKFEEHEI